MPPRNSDLLAISLFLNLHAFLVCLAPVGNGVTSVNHAGAEVRRNMDVAARSCCREFFEETGASASGACPHPHAAKSHAYNVRKGLVNVKIAETLSHDVSPLPHEGVLISFEHGELSRELLLKPGRHSNGEERHALLYSATTDFQLTLHPPVRGLDTANALAMVAHNDHYRIVESLSRDHVLEHRVEMLVHEF